jgi:hypothetical protein
MQAGPLPANVGGDAGAHHGHAVPLPGPGPAQRVPGPARRCRVSTRRGIEAVEPVAEDPGSLVRDERVLAPPAQAVGGCIQRVQVDQAPEGVLRRAVVGGVIPVDRVAEIGEPTEDLLEAAAVDPGSYRPRAGPRAPSSAAGSASSASAQGARARSRGRAGEPASAAPPSSCRRPPCSPTRTQAGAARRRSRTCL